MAQDYRQRSDERLFEVPVTSVRAVVGPPDQRCWVERENVSRGGGANVPGAVIGGVLGGILGHQVGAGRGRDVATVGGAVVGHHAVAVDVVSHLRAAGHDPRLDVGSSPQQGGEERPHRSGADDGDAQGLLAHTLTGRPAATT